MKTKWFNKKAKKIDTFYEIKTKRHDNDIEYNRKIVFLKNRKVDFVLHIWFKTDKQEQLIGFQIHTTEETGILINWNETGEFALNEYHLGHGIRNWQNLSSWKSPENNIIEYYFKRIEDEKIDIKIKQPILEVLIRQMEKREEKLN